MVRFLKRGSTQWKWWVKGVRSPRPSHDHRMDFVRVQLHPPEFAPRFNFGKISIQRSSNIDALISITNTSKESIFISIGDNLIFKVIAKIRSDQDKQQRAQYTPLRNARKNTFHITKLPVNGYWLCEFNLYYSCLSGYVCVPLCKLCFQSIYRSFLILM